MYTAKPPVRLIRQSLADGPCYDAIDNLLYDWFCWESVVVATRGYASVDRTCAQALSERQWQSVDELLDADIRLWQMQQVAAAVADLDSDLLLAIRIESRNRMGASIWRNPRAGDRQPEVYAQAKAAVKPMLARRGVEY